MPRYSYRFTGHAGSGLDWVVEFGDAYVCWCYRETDARRICSLLNNDDENVEGWSDRRSNNCIRRAGAGIALRG